MKRMQKVNLLLPEHFNMDTLIEMINFNFEITYNEQKFGVFSNEDNKLREASYKESRFIPIVADELTIEFVTKLSEEIDV